MLTYDSRTIDSTGVFLVGELERLDKELHMPLHSVTWNRDIDLREDVTIADEAAAFTNTTIAAMGTASTTGKNWVSSKSSEVSNINVDTDKTTNPMHLWAMAMGWTLVELARAQQLGRPIDSTKLEALKIKHNMDVNEQVYIGDIDKGCPGLLNNPNISPLGLGAAWTESTTAAQMLADVNEFLGHAYQRSGYNLCPDRLGLPPVKLGYMLKPVSDAGSESVLSYVMRNSLCQVINGRPLDIVPMKYLAGIGSGSTDRAIAYTKGKAYVRFPMVPLQRTPMEFRGLEQLTTYFGTLGEVEFVQVETVSYADGM